MGLGMDEPYEVGQLYRAVSATELVEIDFRPTEGLKLLVQPENVKILRVLQKKLRERFNEKIPFPVILNAMIAAPINGWDSMVDIVAEKIIEQRERSSQTEQ